jgi:hypothetical protein
MARFLLRLVPLFGLVIAPAVSGCGNGGKPVTMHDSFDVDIFGPRTDDLHTPYVAGAKVTITIDTNDSRDTSKWTLATSDPTVLAVSSPFDKYGYGLQVTAVDPGTARLFVVDENGHNVDEHDVTVALPDRVELHSHGLMLAGLSDDASRVMQARIIAGGIETFLVRYFAGSQELYGNGALHPIGTGDVTANDTTSGFGTEREWLQIVAANQPQYENSQVALQVRGDVVSTVPAAVVAPSEVVSLGLVRQDTSRAKDGDSLSVFGRAYDAQGNDVYGASFSWTAGGAAVPTSLLAANGPSDVLDYTYKAKATMDVSAALDGLGTTTTVHGTQPSIDSSADVACSVGRAPGSGGLSGTAAGGGLGFAAALGLAARRRRRR